MVPTYLKQTEPQNYITYPFHISEFSPARSSTHTQKRGTKNLYVQDSKTEFALNPKENLKLLIYSRLQND